MSFLDIKEWKPILVDPKQKHDFVRWHNMASSKAKVIAWTHGIEGIEGIVVLCVVSVPV